MPDTTTPAVAAAKPSALGIWLMASRPKTLPAAWSPVIIATALAHMHGVLHWPSAVACLLGATLIQIGTNFANDYFDFVKGTDTAERVGPTRVTQAGLVSPGTMRIAMIVVFALVWVPGAYILYRGGWPFLAIGIVSIACGILYTGGPAPLGYVGLGDLFVFVFFGPVAVLGTYYLQAYTLPVEAWIASVSPGLLSVALLTVNNLRDVDGDRVAGKRTLAVRFGKAYAQFQYGLCILVACLVVPLYFYATTPYPFFGAVALASLALGIPAIRALLIFRDEAPRLNQVLARTGLVLVVYSMFFALAAWWGPAA